MVDHMFSNHPMRLVALAVLLGSAGVSAQADALVETRAVAGCPEALRNGHMIERDEVEELLKQDAKKICLFDTAYMSADYAAKFDAIHINGATHFDIAKVTTATPTYRRKLTHPVDFEAYARSLGVTNDCQVVLYHHGEAPLSQLTATYVWWLFEMHGHNKTSVMRGGLNEWQMDGRAVTAGVNDVAHGDIVAEWHRPYYAPLNDVIENYATGAADLVDARDRATYLAGHFKGAKLIESPNLLREGSLKPDDELRAIVEASGVSLNRPIIVYCNTGMQASSVYFALVRLGYTASLYNGGWVEASQLAPEEFKAIN